MDDEQENWDEEFGFTTGNIDDTTVSFFSFLFKLSV
jgi:hypothetical protein